MGLTEDDVEALRAVEGVEEAEEGTFGIIKWDRSYKRLFRRGKESVLLELALISCGYNLYKYHNKKKRIGCQEI